jgi:hypothetical protein
MTRPLLMLVAVVLVGEPTVVPAADPPDPPPAKRKIRELTNTVSGSKRYDGVVKKIDKDGMTLVVVEGGKDPVEHQFAPVDILRRGETMTEVFSNYTYRWGDVRRGDTVRVDTREDEEEEVVYCLAICIRRRPGGKLPESQQPKEDAERYAKDAILNDIENREEVSDADIQKAFPPHPAIVHRGMLVRGALPGGLPAEYQLTLDAIRANKKEAEVKAKSPEKKDDKK